MLNWVGDGLVLELPKPLGVKHRYPDHREGLEVEDVLRVEGVFLGLVGFPGGLQLGEVNHRISPPSRHNNAVPNGTLEGK